MINDEINFLDNNFPKEFREKFYEIEELMNSEMNIKSYNFKYNVIMNSFIIYLKFDIFEINIMFDYDLIKYGTILDIYYRIKIECEKTLLQHLYKNYRGDINEN